jgi:hypothetical protein
MMPGRPSMAYVLGGRGGAYKRGRTGKRLPSPAARCRIASYSTTCTWGSRAAPSTVITSCSSAASNTYASH